jgi:hypothetical protein
VVIAPTDSSYSILTSFLSDDDVVLYHPENLYSFLPFFNTNLFTSFRPTFKRCYPKIDEKKLTRRESLTKDAIKTELIAKSLLHKEIRNSFSNQFLQICKDDPRDKVLYFSAQYDKNQALRSSSNDKLLALLADGFDLMFKEVSLFDEICDTINSVARFDREVSVVIIQAHGKPENGMILSINPDGSEEKIDVSSAFKKCFANVEENGTIIPMGAAIGQSGSHVNIAQKIAASSNVFNLW